MKLLRGTLMFAILSASPLAWTQTISLVANAEGESAIIAPNTWVEIKGTKLAKANDSRIWQASDFVNSNLPTALMVSA